jgi:hypothetical protein
MARSETVGIVAVTGAWLLREMLRRQSRVWQPLSLNQRSTSLRLAYANAMIEADPKSAGHATVP